MSRLEILLLRMVFERMNFFDGDLRFLNFVL
jgi:hypothetical protein